VANSAVVRVNQNLGAKTTRRHYGMKKLSLRHQEHEVLLIVYISFYSRLLTIRTLRVQYYMTARIRAVHGNRG
jgi:hypothetical protein